MGRLTEAIRTNLSRLWTPNRSIVPAPATALDFLADLPLRRSDATDAAAVRQAQEALGLGGALGLDLDDVGYRRLTGGNEGRRLTRRDLTPIQFDRALEIGWYLWEQNPLARRLITLMTDLILGEGCSVVSDDGKVQAEIDKTWGHPSNTLLLRGRELLNFLSLTGELILPVVPNPITGRPVFGFIEPYTVQDIIPDPNNVLIPDTLLLKPENGGGEGKRLKIMRVNPGSDRMEGEVFYFRINGLPNSLRGRGDLLPLADWLDLYDQYMFAEVERLQLMSAFVWDWKVTGLKTKAQTDAKLAEFPTPKPGSVFIHNENEELNARTPDLKATDRSEVARLLRTHIAGSLGFPLSYLGEMDSNRATIEGQNDVMLKTPAARQKEFSRIIGTLAEYVIQSTKAKNPGLFKGTDGVGFKVVVPEIAAKDIARVGQVVSSVIQGLDTAMTNKTMSRKAAVGITIALVKHLGVELDPMEIIEEADKDAKERQEEFDNQQAKMAANVADEGAPLGGSRAIVGRKGNPNPPVPDDDAKGRRAAA
jgi:hypothetical protein